MMQPSLVSHLVGQKISWVVTPFGPEKGLFLGHVWPKLKLYESVPNFGIRASEGTLVV